MKFKGDKRIMIILYIILVIVFSSFEIAISDDCEGRWVYQPKDLKKYTDMNLFGCCVLYILLILFSPIIFIGKMIYLLFHI